MMSSILLFLAFLFLVTVSVYALSSIFTTSDKPDNSSPSLSYYEHLLAREQIKKRGERNILLPFMLITVLSTSTYMVYHYHQHKDIETSRQEHSALSIYRGSTKKEQANTLTDYSKATDVVKQALITAEGSRRIGEIVASQAGQIYSPLHYVNSWGIQLVTKEPALRWVRDFTDQMEPYCRNGKHLMINATKDSNGEVLHSFYLGPFQDRASAQRLLRTIGIMLPDAHLVPLKTVPNLRPFEEKTKA